MSLRNHRWREVLQVLTKFHGFHIHRQHGSHIILVHIDGRHVVLVRRDPIKLGTLKSILIQADVTQGQFLQDTQRL